METKVLKINVSEDYTSAIREAADCLSAGGLVVFPTETVYGLGACAANPAALSRLREVKQRTGSKPFTVHIGSRSAIDAFVPDLRGVGRRIVEKAWPGPLTVVFEVPDVQAAPIIRENSGDCAQAMYHEGTIGVRYPDDPVAAELLTAVNGPVVAASANPANAPAPVDAEEALSTLNGQVDLVLDAGRTRYARPSTIVRLDGDKYRIIREGVLDERTVRRLTNLSFLLICAGNTCRSPMAEGLLRRILSERLGCEEHELAGRGYNIESAGMAAANGMAPPPSAVRAMQARGIDISGHGSQPVTVEQINRSDYILTMTAGQLEAVASMAADAYRRSQRINEEDIEDPIGGSDEVYEKCAQRLDEALRRKLEDITL